MNTNTRHQIVSQSLSKIDNDLGSCGRAGRQKPAPTALDLPPHGAEVQLADAARLIGATDLFGRPLDRRQLALADGFAARRQNWAAWPIIGARQNLSDTRGFDWTLHSSNFRAGTTISVYAAVCDGICSLGKAARLSLSKIGISTRADLSARMAEANADRYGSLHESDGKLIDEAGYDSWEPLRLPPDVSPHRLSPVERLPRSLSVSLPASLGVEAFDAAFTAMLANCEVSRWVATPDGERHCARLDVDARRLHRLTAHTNADGTIRLKRSTEIYVFRRAEDTDLLVTSIEGLIAQHLIAQEARRAGADSSPAGDGAEEPSIPDIATRFPAVAGKPIGGRS